MFIQNRLSCVQVNRGKWSFS